MNKMVRSLKKHFNKKRLLVCMVCCILLGRSLPVCADAIWEPSDDFYWSHAGECEILAEDYLTNSKKGYVTVYESPQSDTVVAEIENGKRFYVGFSWTDDTGCVWGALDLGSYEPTEGESIREDVWDGWLPMEELAELYGEGDFRTARKAEIVEARGGLEGHEIEKAVLFWEYPGSDRITQRLEQYFSEDERPVYWETYTDPDGKEWGYVGYYYGYRGWVCISNPEEENLENSYGPGIIEQTIYPAVNPASKEDVKESDKTSEADEKEEQFSEEEKKPAEQREELLKTAGKMVAAVTALTAVLIALLFRKKKGDER